MGGAWLKLVTSRWVDLRKVLPDNAQCRDVEVPPTPCDKRYNQAQRLQGLKEADSGAQHIGSGQGNILFKHVSHPQDGFKSPDQISIFRVSEIGSFPSSTVSAFKKIT